MKSGPVAGVTIDEQSLSHECRNAMGRDPVEGRPSQETLKRLQLVRLVNNTAKLLVQQKEVIVLEQIHVGHRRITAS